MRPATWTAQGVRAAADGIADGLTDAAVADLIAAAVTSRAGARPRPGRRPRRGRGARPGGVLRGTFDTVAARLAGVRARLAAADEALDAVAARGAAR